MGEDDKIQELQRESEYLYAQLEEITKELARLDLLNIKLTQQKRQAIAAFNFIKFIQEKIEKASTIDDLYFNIVNVMTAHLFMDSSALLKINFETKDVSILASAGLSEDLKGLKLDETVSKQELVKPTFVSSKSSLQSFQEFVRDGFKFPYFVWYPIADEEDGTLVLFVGNKVEDTVLKQPFSEESLETFGAIASVILLRRDNIATTLEMLRKKEERINFLVEILETSPVSVIATDKDVKITYVNLATEKLTGYKAEELIGKDLGMLNADPKAAEIQKELVDTISQGKVWRGEILNKKKNGELYYILASVYQLLDEKGNFMAMVGFQEDITERKKAEEALQSSELQYRTTIDSVDDPIHVVDKDLRIILFNNAFKRWAEELNLETEVIGQTLFEPFPFLPGKVREEYLQVFNTGKPLITEETVKVGSKEFITETRKIPVFEGEKVVRVITVVRDITEKKKAEEALKQRAEELEKSKVELQRSLQELLERVEHEYKDLVTRPIPEIDIEEKGAIFLYPADREEEAYALFGSRKDANLPALAITRTFPPRFYEKLGREVETVWLTSNRVPGMVCVDPSDTMNLILVLSEFFKRTPEGVVLFEGVEYVISIAGFKRFLHIVQLLNDKIAMTNGTIYMILDLGVLEEKEARYIMRECLPPLNNVRAKEEV